MSDEKINPKEVRAICSEYAFEEENAMWEEDKRVYAIKKALASLDKADYIIWCLYMEMQSERKVAKQLGVSRTPINKAIKRIKREITTKILEDNEYDNI